MSTEQQEYVVVPWGEGECDTEDRMIELPSRELVAHLEVPTSILQRMAQLGDRHGITTERALAERLEINRARVAVTSAKAADETAQVRDHLVDACELLAGVEALATDEVETEIETVWRKQLESS